MIRTLRSLFLGCMLREKLLLLAILLIAAAWWGLAFSRRAGILISQSRATTAALKDQADWLNRSAAVDEAAQKAASRLVPAETLNSVKLSAAVNQAAREAGLKSYRTTPSPDESNGQFTIHSLRAQIDQADYETLLKFYLNLHQRAPYLAVEEFTLNPLRGNPNLLNLNVRVSSVEIAR